MNAKAIRVVMTTLVATGAVAGVSTVGAVDQPNQEVKAFSKLDTNADKRLSKQEAKNAGLRQLVDEWDTADSDNNGSLSKPELSSYLQEHDTVAKAVTPSAEFSEADADGNEQLTEEEARMAGFATLIQKWDQVDHDNNASVSREEFVSFMKKQHGPSKTPEPAFAQVDANGDKKVTKQEAQQAGASRLVTLWNSADKTNNGSLSEDEYTAFMKKPGDKKPTAMTVGLNKFMSPETVLWDEKADVYLVSNINGKLVARDDNGFISRVSPDGTIMDLKWIDGARPEVTLHGPKGMIFHGGFLVVADVGAVHFFDRSSGKAMHSIMVPDSHMLNDLALGSDGAIYVSDVGSEVAEPPGAVYRMDAKQQAVVIAKGIDFDRPDGLIPHGNGLLVAPFEAHAKELYVLSLDGEKSAFASVPKPKLDGLLRLPDDSIIVTSWGGKAIYRLVDKKAEAIVEDISSPAQVDYDSKRGRLLVPVLRENKLLIYPLSAGK